MQWVDHHLIKLKDDNLCFDHPWSIKEDDQLIKSTMVEPTTWSINGWEFYYHKHQETLQDKWGRLIKIGMASSSLTGARLFCFVFPNFLCYISSHYPKRHLAGKWQKVLARVKSSLNFDRKFQIFFRNLAIFSPNTLGICDRNNFILAFVGNFSQKQRPDDEWYFFSGQLLSF
jgi:hypothetical protein